MRFLVCVALLVTMTAGCLESGSNKDTGLSAYEGTEAAALAWSEDASLVALQSFELRSESPMVEDFGQSEGLQPYLLDVQDEPVGDGRSSLWVALYDGPDGSLVVYWTPNRVIEQNVTNFSLGMESFAIDDISIDSDAAAEALAEADEEWLAVRSETEAFGFSQLVSLKGEPYWNLFASGENGTTLDGYVHAITGNVTDLGALEPEVFTGAMSAGGSVTFEVAHDHQLLEMQFQASDGDPLIGTGVTITLTNPLGKTETFQVAAGGGYSLSVTGHAGPWTVSASTNDLLFNPQVSFSAVTVG